jgi:hypothetical protein
MDRLGAREFARTAGSPFSAAARLHVDRVRALRAQWQDLGGDAIAPLVDLARAGLTLNSDQLARLHAPVGLDLGAERPAEVALAILAEMQAALTRRDARPLRERTRPIHG